MGQCSITILAGKMALKKLRWDRLCVVFRAEIANFLGENILKLNEKSIPLQE
jgi:hypothetical protein